MKIEGPNHEKIEDLPVLPLKAGDGDTAEEILASLPDVPLCVRCLKKTQEVDESLLCPVCRKNGDTVPTPAEVFAGARVLGIVTIDVTPAPEEGAKPDPRPSVDVAIDSHTNLGMTRLTPFIVRLRTWDLRKLDAEKRIQFTGAVADLEAAFERLGRELSRLQASGFVAKTTQATRIAARLEPGARVHLRDDKRLEFAALYSKEQLDSLEVSKVVGAHAFVVAGDGTSLGAVKIIHLELKKP